MAVWSDGEADLPVIYTRGGDNTEDHTGQENHRRHRETTERASKINSTEKYQLQYLT